jgi:hypothetical protein
LGGRRGFITKEERKNSSFRIKIIFYYLSPETVVLPAIPLAFGFLLLPPPAFVIMQIHNLNAIHLRGSKSVKWAN